MSHYFDLQQLRHEMSDSRLLSKRFEMVQTFKLNSLKELCGRLPEDGEAFFIENPKKFFCIHVHRLSAQTWWKDKSFVCSDLLHQ